MNNLQQAEMCLIAWGQWQRGSTDLDYPHLNLIGRCIIEGPSASHSTARTEPHMPAMVIVAEQCVLTLRKPLQRAAKHRYIGNEPDLVASQKLKVSLDIYQSRIAQVVQNMADYLVEN